MKYLFSDYYFLCGAADKETRTVGDAYRKMCGYLDAPASCGCLLHALRGLAAGGYITVEPEDHHGNQVVSLNSPIAVTKAGKEAVAISGLQKLFGERKAFVKNQLHFCSLERPDDPVGADWWVDSDALMRINCEGEHDGDWNTPLFALNDSGDGYLSMTLHHSTCDYGVWEGESDSEREASVTVTGDAARIMQGISDLLSAAHVLLTEPPRTRKVAIHGADRSLVITLAQAAGEQGSYLRMTVAQIRFNRQRFYGKRDGDLDYAQCGDALITAEFLNARELAARLLPCAVALPDRLSEADLENIDTLCKLLQ